MSYITDKFSSQQITFTVNDIQIYIIYPYENNETQIIVSNPFRF
jgi:hypothetical protein